MAKSRFQQEISGDLGQFWQVHAVEELEEIKADVEAGQITIDENGIARNCIGRVVMSDLLEKLIYIFGDAINEKATKLARDIEVSEAVAEYKKNYTGPSAEELAEMKAAFGEGETIVDIITGETIVLA